MFIKSNVLILSDSRALPRNFEEVRFEDTWVSLVGNHCNVYMRGYGGSTSRELVAIFKRDYSYFADQPGVILILFVGIVDAAPRPFTFAFRRFRPRFFWLPLIKILKPLRPKLQKILSYRLISPKEFRANIKFLCDKANLSKWKLIVVSIPLPTNQAEERSPGFQESVYAYNSILREISSLYPGTAYIDLSPVGENFFVSKEDGHHLSKAGHLQLGTEVLKHIDLKEV